MEGDTHRVELTALGWFATREQVQFLSPCLLLCPQGDNSSEGVLFDFISIMKQKQMNREQLNDALSEMRAKALKKTIPIV
jgi:hypothetical protein